MKRVGRNNRSTFAVTAPENSESWPTTIGALSEVKAPVSQVADEAHRAYERAADKHAQDLGVSRSEFFATAARRDLEELDRSTLTQQIDEALARINFDDSASAAVAAGHDRLARPDD